MDDLVLEVVRFRDRRDGWRELHTPAHLAAAISIEAAELLECYQWGEEPMWDAACQELADVLIYALSMCDALGVTPQSIVKRKLAINEERFPCP